MINPQLSRLHLLFQAQLYFFKTHQLEQGNSCKLQFTQARNQTVGATEGPLKTTRVASEHEANLGSFFLT